MNGREYVLGTTRRQSHRFWDTFYEDPPEGFRVAKVWDIPYSYVLGPYRANSFLVTLKTFVPTCRIDLYEVKNFIVTNHVPWVVIVESILPLYEKKNRGKYLYRKSVELLCSQYCRKIVFWSALAKKMFTERLNEWRADLDPRYEIVYPAVKPLPPVPKYDDGRIHIVFAGYAFFRKGGRELVEAFRKLNCKRAVLHLVTDFTPDSFMTGTKGGDGRRWRQEVGREENVVVHDNLGQSGVVQLMQQSHVFCLPSLWDTFGFVCLEALSCGLPCIVTNVGALPEVIEDGHNGFVIQLPVNRHGHLVRPDGKPFDNRRAMAECRDLLITELTHKLRLLVEDEDLRRQMGERALETQRGKFDFEKRRVQMGTIYRNALAV
jgi:glycosyltransferase involved in cell wall biosynthesis